MLLELALATAAAFAQEGPPTLHAPEPGTVSATAVCGAGHDACRGMATIFLVTQDGPAIIDGCKVVAGEMFHLSGEISSIPWRFDDEVVLQLTLDGHHSVAAERIPLWQGCQLGSWLVPEKPAGPPKRRRWDQEPKPVGNRLLTLVLNGGVPSDGIATVEFPQPAMLCGLSGRPSLTLTSPCVRRIDWRTWSLDLDGMGALRDVFPLRIGTLSGATLAPRAAAGGEQDPPSRLDFDAPPRPVELRGMIVDRNGHAVPGARVMIAHPDGLFSKWATSSEEGVFTLQSFASSFASVRVNDACWRSPNPFGERFDGVKGEPPQMTITVDRQRWIQVDATELRWPADADAALAVWNASNAGTPMQLQSVIVLDAAVLAQPFRIPAAWGNDFAVSLIPVPVGGAEHDGDLATWLDRARVSRCKVSFPDGDRAAVTRFARMKPR